MLCVAGADCSFSEFGGHRVVHAWQGANATFVNCEFTNNTFFVDPEFFGSGAIVASAGEPPSMLHS